MRINKVIAGIATLAVATLAVATPASATEATGTASVDCYGDGTLTVSNNTTQEFVDARPGLDWEDGQEFTIVIHFEGSSYNVPFNGTATIPLEGRTSGETLSWVTSWHGERATYSTYTAVVVEVCEQVTTTAPEPTTTTTQPTTTTTQPEELTTTTQPTEVIISTTVPAPTPTPTTQPQPQPILPVTGSSEVFTISLLSLGGALIVSGRALVGVADKRS